MTNSVDTLRESPECSDEPSKESLLFLVSLTCESEGQDITTQVNAFRVRNINISIVAYININSIRNKIDILADGVRGKWIFV